MLQTSMWQQKRPLVLSLKDKFEVISKYIQIAVESSDEEKLFCKIIIWNVNINNSNKTISAVQIQEIWTRMWVEFV